MSSLDKEIKVEHGQYHCWISRKWGYVINPAYLDTWGIEEIREYAEFCNKLADAKAQWEKEHRKKGPGGTLSCL